MNETIIYPPKKTFMNRTVLPCPSMKSHYGGTFHISFHG